MMLSGANRRVNRLTMPAVTLEILLRKRGGGGDQAKGRGNPVNNMYLGTFQEAFWGAKEGGEGEVLDGNARTEREK